MRENARTGWVINTFSEEWHESEAQMEHAEETPKLTHTHTRRPAARPHVKTVCPPLI